jgi:hypothetical protein
MKPIFSRERKKFCLRSGTKPQRGSYLSGVVLVLDEEGKGYAYVRFADSLVVAIGHAMPYGVGPDNPCYLKVLYMRSRVLWRVFAVYVDESRVVLLWETREKPAWLNRVRRHHE